MDNRKKVIWRSFLLTALVFATGMLLNHVFDSFRIDAIVDVMRVHEIDSESYQVERTFTKVFGGEGCDAMAARLADFKSEIRRVGEDLGSYSRFSFFRKNDYDYLKRKYFLLELNFFSLLQVLNNECDDPYVPILFFYKIDDDASERQGYILQELSKEYERELIVLSLDKEYKDEQLVQVIAQSYNITSAPSMVIDKVVYTGLVYTGSLNATIQKRIHQVDPYAQGVDFMFTPRAAGLNMSLLGAQLEAIMENQSVSAFARGDAVLVQGRLERNDSMICKSLEFFDQVNTTSFEEKALLAETSASLGCGRNRAAFLRAASKEWARAGNTYRAWLDDQLAKGLRPKFAFDPAALAANVTVITGYATAILPNLSMENISALLVGNTSIILNSSSRVVSQDDRVYRDWLGGQLADPYGPDLLVTFSERLTYHQSELQSEIGWHEGARIRDLKKVNIKHIPAVGALVAKSGDRWFAIDDNGVFRFEVPLDKLYYPTTRFIAKDLAVIIDTHGVNMLVESALRYNASAVLSDCDHPGKVYAAKYLSDAGVDVVCFPDKYAYLALGHDLRLVGSPPIHIENQTAIIGGRPILINFTERIVAINATPSAYALWYYQTPSSYFDELRKAYGLNVTFVTLEEFGQMEMAVQKARDINATVLATRIFNRSDYDAVRSWLAESKSNRAILFHSASYPFGQRLFTEFANQTSFDDPNPVPM
ncbi:MAG TPA: hypothetical protein VJJ82_04920 [Candidatus Nanoarchaeia archaeon]|nr:hypothetical protein [Candidatus Nanoarchaeia archaeon]